jgi:nitrate/TMAO reductase-like tetraheme cytochrome c subunit
VTVIVGVGVTVGVIVGVTVIVGVKVGVGLPNTKAVENVQYFSF